MAAIATSSSRTAMSGARHVAKPATIEAFDSIAKKMADESACEQL
jgi:hypothetical protein